MKERILKYIKEYYSIDSYKQKIIQIENKQPIFLIQIKSDVELVFGIGEYKIIEYISEWAAQNGLTDILEQWELKPMNLETGFIYAPYIPLQTVSIIDDFEFSPSNQVISRYTITSANINPNYYGTISITQSDG